MGGGKTQWRGMVSSPDEPQGQIGTVVRRPLGANKNSLLQQTCYASDGTTLVAGAEVDLILDGVDINVDVQISDASGVVKFWNPGSGPFHTLAYKLGSPDISGTSAEGLIATQV
jgi:hypothetical protein